MKKLLLFYNLCRHFELRPLARSRLALIMASLLIPNLTLAAQWTAEGQIYLGQRQFLKDPPLAPPEYQKSGGFLWASPSLQYAGEKTRFRFKGIAGLENTEFDPKDRTQLIPQELFIEHSAPHFRALFGLNTYHWGVTDLINPMDVINPRWMRSPLNPIKIGSLSLALSWAFKKSEIDFVYIPRQFRHELPTPSSRALPRDLSVAKYVAEFQDQQTPIQMPSPPLRFKISEAQDPSRALENNLALRWRQSLGDLDLQAVVFEGIPSFPDFSNPGVNLNVINTPPQSLELQPEIELIPRYQRIRLASLGGTWTLPSFLLKFVHAETWRTGHEYEIALPRTSVLAFEKPTRIAGLEATWLYQFAVIQDSSRLAKSIYSSREIFDQSHLLGLKLTSDFKWSVNLSGLINPKNETQILQVDSRHRINDQWQLKLGAQLIQGRQGSLAQALAGASNLQMGFLVFW